LDKFVFAKFNYNIEDFCESLLNISIRGIDGIYSAKIIGNKVVTEGINYLGVLSLKDKNITNIFTDNTFLNQKVFGINFTRLFMQTDIKRILKINYSHISVFVDAHIRNLWKWETDIFNLMASSSTRKHLENGTKKQMYANCDDVSSSLIAGQLAKIGTNFNTICINHNYFQ